MLWSVTGDGQVAGQSAKFRENIVDLDKCCFKKHGRLQLFQLLAQTTVFSQSLLILISFDITIKLLLLLVVKLNWKTTERHFIDLAFVSVLILLMTISSCFG